MSDSKRIPKEIAALGRPFNLGMLYDCRTDTLVAGMTLWNHEELEKDMMVSPKPNTEFNIDTSSSISDKSNSLGVNAGLKASFCSGLISIEGSANYLKDSKTSKNQARVSFQYKTTTEFKELTMNQLGPNNIQYPKVFETDIATHVVTGILYGAAAIFVFDREVSDTENVQDIEGELEVTINKIPSVSIDGHGKLDMKDEDKEKVNKYSCTFHGDVRPKTNPVTFEEAVKVFEELPTLLGDKGENAVPVQVWLLPLNALDSKAAKLVREISETLVNDAVQVLENLGELKIRCNDYLKLPAVQQFQQLAKTINTFKALCDNFKVGFQGTLAKKLPAIRGGGEEEEKLAEILKKTDTSPFNSEYLNQWMDSKDREASILMSLTKLLKNTKTVPSQSDLYKEISGFNKAVCFVFTSLQPERTDPYLCALKKYLQDQPDNWAPDEEKEQWYDSDVNAIRNKAKLFGDFAEANKDDSNVKFLAVGLKDENHQGSTIYLYKGGFSISVDFQPPSEPEAVTVGGVEHNTVVVEFSPPRFGAEAVTGYRVEYCVKGETEWHQQNEAIAGAVPVAGLKPHTEYSFRVRALTDVGLGPAAQLVNSIKTLPCGPPEDLDSCVNGCEITLKWKYPTEIGQDVVIEKYIVEYKQSENENQWKQEVSTCTTKAISGLQKSTAYNFRVLCDCGKNLKSKETKVVTVLTERE